MSSQTFVAYGGFGGVNVGDEAILLSLVSSIKSAGRGLITHVIAGAQIDPVTAQEYERLGIKYVRKSEFLRIVSLLRRSRLVVGGGQLLNGARFPKGLAYIAVLVAMARWFGTRAACVGIGADGVDNWLSRFLIRFICKQCSIVHCRDSATVDLLRGCGVRGNIDQTADIVFTLADSESIRYAGADADRKTIAFAVHRDPNWKLDSSNRILDLVASFLECEDYQQYQFVLAAHDKRTEFDAGLEEEVTRRFGDRVNFVVLQTVSQALDLYGKSQYTISSRMHPVILSVLCRATPIPICETSKLKALSAELGLSAIDVPEDAPAIKIFEQAKQICDSGCNAFERIREQVERLNELALVNWEI